MRLSRSEQVKAPEVKAFADILEGRLEHLKERVDELTKKLTDLANEQKQTLQALNDARLKLETENTTLKHKVEELSTAKAERKQEREEYILLKREIEDLKKWKDEQKKDRDEKSRRLWAFGPNIAGAIVTAILSIIISIATILIVSYFNRTHP